jgi:hypothetical protein
VAQTFAPAIQRALSAAAVGTVALAGLAWPSVAAPHTTSSLPRPAIRAASPMYPRDSPEPDRPARRQVVVLALIAPASHLPTNAAANSFAYGYCTWWVAQKRPIPWRGDAWQWWANARLLGYSEGGVPVPGAVAVFKAGGWSAAGHVAFVETVNADGSFVVSEMNWGRWGVIDVRTISSLGDIIGFIY